MADQFILDVVQASELKFAAERNGVTNADLKKLSSGDMFAQILPVLRGYGKVVVEDTLRFVGEMVFPGVVKFIARDNFVLNTHTGAKVKISYFGDNFKNWFLSKIEADIPTSTLVYGELAKNSLDEPIIQSLGGEEKAETSLAEVFHLMSLQSAGEYGALLTNGYANIFYVRDAGGTLRVVVVYWNGDGWGVNADSTSSPGEWYAGRRVFSCKAI